MPIDPENSWIETVNKLPPTKTAPEGFKALAKAVDACVTSKAQLTGIVGPPPTFTFNKALFLTGLLSMGPVPATPAGVTAFVQAWAGAVTASVMVVSPGSAFGAAAPPTLFSVVISAILDPPSLAAAQSALIAELTASGLKPVKNYKDSKVGPGMLKAFKLLSYTVTGLNSIPPPAGPLPLVAPLCLLM